MRKTVSYNIISRPSNPELYRLTSSLRACGYPESEDLVDFDRGRKQVPRGRGKTTVSLTAHDPFLFKFLFCLSLHRIKKKEKESPSFTRPCFLTTVLRQRNGTFSALHVDRIHSGKKVTNLHTHTRIVISKLFSSIRMASYVRTPIY